MAFEDINHFLEAMLHTARFAGFRDVDQENRCIVAASVQMDEGAVCFRKVPAACFQSQQVEAEALVDRNALRLCPIAIWAQQDLVAAAHAAHSARAPEGRITLRSRLSSSPAALWALRRPQPAFSRSLRRSPDQRQASFALPRF